MNGRARPVWVLLVRGLVLGGAGLVLILTPVVPWLGRLPGDIQVERDNFRFYLPLTTCLLLSALVSLAHWAIRSGGASGDALDNEGPQARGDTRWVGHEGGRGPGQSFGQPGGDSPGPPTSCPGS
jgi:hypothetical protein